MLSNCAREDSWESFGLHGDQTIQPWRKSVLNIYWKDWSWNSNTLAAAAKLFQSCPTLRDPIDGSPPASCPWDSPGKNTRVGCHFLLQCVNVKSESEVTQSCLTLHDPMDCSLPGSSSYGTLQARVLEWGAITFSDTLATWCKEQTHLEKILMLGKI